MLSEKVSKTNPSNDHQDCSNHLNPLSFVLLGSNDHYLFKRKEISNWLFKRILKTTTLSDPEDFGGDPVVKNDNYFALKLSDKDYAFSGLDSKKTVFFDSVKKTSHVFEHGISGTFVLPKGSTTTSDI